MHLKDGKVCLPTVSRDSLSRWGRQGSKSHVPDLTASMVRKQKEMDADLLLSFSPGPSHGMLPPCSGWIVSLLSSNPDNPSQACPEVCNLGGYRSCQVENQHLTVTVGMLRDSHSALELQATCPLLYLMMVLSL